MKKVFRIILNVLLTILSLFFWIIFPPILLLIPIPIKKFWIRLVLCVLSPLGVLFGAEICFYIDRKYRYSHDEINNMIHIELPEYEVVDYNEDLINTHLVIGYEMKKILEFKEYPSQMFYNELDSLCRIDGTGWRNKEYYQFYGDVELQIKRDSKFATFEYSDIEIRH